ncbi:MAG: endopeptidase La [Gammaproteobacteria bacterium]|nr:endopeptidase La [Gammaproteobacteria bacterium]
MNEEQPQIILPHDDGEATARVPALARDVLPEQLLVLPLRARPYFPAQTMPLVIEDEPWRETIERVGNTPHKLVGLVYSRHPAEIDVPRPEDFAVWGTVARVHHPMREDGRIQFIAEGIERFRIKSWIKTERPFVAHAEYPRVAPDQGKEVRAYALAIINKIKELLPLNPLYKESLKAFLDRFTPDNASPLADFAAAMTSADAEQLQEVLETVPLLRRMEKVLLLIQHELEVAGLQSEIRKRVEERISEQQREFFLREQLKQIQKELGISKDDKTVELERYRDRLDGRSVPEDARRRIEAEMDKFAVLEPGSPEYGVTRNYLDALTDLPWGVTSPDNVDLDHARKVLDRDHAGLEDVKERIIEFIGVGKLRGEIAGSILLLVGPPGVGKTSIGQSVANALGRRFYRFSVGGMRDEAEIKGHRRTYIGAMPGKFVQAVREAGTMNPVIMLDEIDKVGASYQGDPAAALLEVLDPEQNTGFLDHYLDVRMDLSKVLFVCTANQLDSIPRPLLDRMEVIRLSGYLTAEKVTIGSRYLWPKQRARAGLAAGDVRINAAAMKAIAENYAREAGVRNLEKLLGRIARKAAIRTLRGEGGAKGLSVTTANLADFLGHPPFRKQTPNRGLGIVTGLAWTALGGATLDVEATVVHSKNRGFKLTGQLGEVMRESAEIAYSHVAAHLGDYGGAADFFDEAFVHLHVPEGATPKDGPSAGITMATALLSLARGAKPKRAIAMTGELTLTGRVLAVGGIREKIIAARRAGVREIILPAAVKGEFAELPAYIHQGMTVHFVADFAEVVRIAFD